ncbi:MAG: hypothetical protein H8E14_12465 [Candidatus Marinimicrobia bacterium]|nr:hypothetical protein [Candidatus Neomarinimicrobiota bacterium]
MKHLRSILIISFLVISSEIFAQIPNLSFLISGNLTLPVGLFGQGVGDDAKLTRRSGFDVGKKIGYAGTGVGFGVDFLSATRNRKIDWLLGTTYYRNGTDVSELEAKFEELLGDTTNLKFEYGSWNCMTLMTGFRYKRSLSGKLAFYGSIKAGINLTKAATRKVIRPEIITLDSSYTNVTVEETIFDYAMNFGYELGLGFDFANKFNFELKYLSLGNPRYEGIRKISDLQFPGIFDRNTTIIGEERSISMVLLTFGFYLI